MVVHMHGDRGYHRRVIRSSLVDLQDEGKLKIESRKAIVGREAANGKEKEYGTSA
jgi:acyl-CoA hydrolase